MPLLVDADFSNYLATAQKVAQDSYQTAMEQGDEEQGRYLRGLMRGLRMAEESYEICVSMVDRPDPEPRAEEPKWFLPMA